MSDIDKGRALYASQHNQASTDAEPDPEVTGIERGRQLWQRRKNRNGFEAPELSGTDVTPGGDAA
ncbi:hypothetical protein [Streptomyces europaeiscabiei]|uniref:hypothetical protein n=1 Tax=Streptomyces europaeiscabiei TaxID=146819 RepID=UPI0029A6A8B0|nr:hypothetical protein [Streptomyces europaeiscabiei]MDX2770638.1 hypothetical protein [Streptomyces europaeiscabiei]